MRIRTVEVRRLSEIGWSLLVRLAVLLVLGGMLVYGMLSFWRMATQTSMDVRPLLFMPIALAGALGVVIWRACVVARELAREIRAPDAEGEKPISRPREGNLDDG